MPYIVIIETPKGTIAIVFHNDGDVCVVTNPPTHSNIIEVEFEVIH